MFYKIQIVWRLVQATLFTLSLTVAATGIKSAAAETFSFPIETNRLIPVSSNRYYTPRKGSVERRQIMNASRIPVSRDIGQRVIFVVDILRSDGNFVYMQAVPHQSNGNPLNWARTDFRNDWLNDAMSDVVMVLLVRRGQGWRVLDYVIGPTDVHWYGWLERYNLPESLFNPGAGR